MAKEKTEYISKYTPSLLESIPRKDQRESLGIGEELPFNGLDIWNAYDFTWLNSKGKPEVAVAQFQVPGNSPRLIESKSMKLYLGSYSNTPFSNRNEVIKTLESDLRLSAQVPVAVTLHTPDQTLHEGMGHFQGTSIDHLDIETDRYDWSLDYLELESMTIVREALYTNLFRSLCPMTGQPDYASVLIQYSGNSISHEGLLKYLISYRNHPEFSEQITERIFVDLMNSCSPDRLSVTTRFSRRGGVEINSHRAHEENIPPEVRLWRQ